MASKNKNDMISLICGIKNQNTTNKTNMDKSVMVTRGEGELSEDEEGKGSNT